MRDNAITIQGLSEKVANHHGTNHPELYKLNEGTQHFLRDLLQHLEKEEQVLFPAIKNAVAQKRAGNAVSGMSVKQPIMMMQREHEIAGEDLTYFRKLTNEYALPEDACNSYSYLFEKMKAFEDDLHQHIHLENNILFPKALSLEN